MLPTTRKCEACVTFTQRGIEIVSSYYGFENSRNHNKIGRSLNNNNADLFRSNGSCLFMDFREGSFVYILSVENRVKHFIVLSVCIYTSLKRCHRHLLSLSTTYKSVRTVTILTTIAVRPWLSSRLDCNK